MISNEDPADCRVSIHESRGKMLRRSQDIGDENETHEMRNSFGVVVGAII